MKIWKYVLSAAVLAGISGCGGGGGDSSANSPGSPMQGLWTGTTGSGNTFGGLVLDDGSFWLIYSGTGGSSTVGGAMHGNASASGGTFTSSNGRDYNLETWSMLNFTISNGTYTEKSTMAGTVTYTPSVSQTFTATYDNSYELTPSLATIAGSYTGQVATPDGTDTVIFTVNGSNGNVAGVSGTGCFFSGTSAPRAKGNVYNVSITFGTGCGGSATGTVTGVAHFDAGTNRLRSMALNGDRTYGYIVEGVK